MVQKQRVKTFPRPKRIPENYKIQISDKGVGMKYVHPTNPHLAVRVMPGKPHSKHPAQRKPYVVYRINKKAVGKYGNLVPFNKIEAHISLEEFIYRK